HWGEGGGGGGGGEVLIEWSIHQKGYNLLGQILGEIVANFDNIPIRYEKWPDVPSSYKAKIWEDIKTKFQVSEEHKKYMIANIGKKWRDNRIQIFDDCYKKILSWEENLKRSPKGVDKKDYTTFLNYQLANLYLYALR
ncbi:hypothetical protein RYX36_016541, partial [Vicia faba]